MNKKTKSSIIVASLASIAAAGSLIAGATYALFTSESKTNIVATSGKVEIAAKVDAFQTWSGVDLTGDTSSDVIAKTEENGVFTNGGTATYDETTGEFKLDKMTPGDKVTFTIDVENLSNVAVKYRTTLILDETTSKELFDALKVTFNGEEFKGSTASHWKKLDVGTNPEKLDVVIELPSNVKNEYQDKSCTIVNTVEAIQGNAAVYDIEVSDEDGFIDALNSSTDSTSIKVTEDITLSSRYTVKTKDLAIYGDGETAIKGSDVRIFNIWGDEDDTVQMNGGSLYLSGVDLLLPTSKESYKTFETRVINLTGLDGFDLTINNCEIETSGYGIYIRNNINNVKLRVNNSKITGYCAFETRCPYSDFKFTKSTLTGVNQWANPSGSTSNNYGTIIVDAAATNSTFVFEDCDIYATDAVAGEGEVAGLERFVENYTTSSTLNFDADCKFWHNGAEVENRTDFESNVYGNTNGITTDSLK